MTTLLEQALDLAARGYRVLPLQRGSRKPNLHEWQHLASDNPQQIDSWWSRKPNANIGILTGGTFIVIDVDIKSGKHGAKSLAELKARYNLPQTYTVRTASGGLHLYYQHPEPGVHIKNRVNWHPAGISTKASGLDIRADGGQVVAPGMQVDDYPGATYKVIFDIPRATLPPSLVPHLPYKEPQDGTSTEPQTKHTAVGTRDNTTASVGGSLSSVPDYARTTGHAGGAAAGLVTTNEKSEYSSLPTSIPAGGRDDTIFRYLCSWRERNYPIDHAAVLATELHRRLEQPAGDVISLSDILAKLRRTYATYNPSESDKVALQAVRPTQPLSTIETPAPAQIEAQAAAEGLAATNLADELGLEPQGSDITPPPESVVDALNRFVLCVESNTVIDTTKHPQYAVLKMDSFKSAFGNISLKSGGRTNAKYYPLPKLWVQHTNRQTVDDYGYLPNGPQVFDHLGTRFYNRWAPSELHREYIDTPRATLESTPNLKIFWDHLDLIFEDDVKERQAFLNWLAYSIRYPERRISHGVLIVSDPGVGKSWFYRLIQCMAGIFNVNTASNVELTSNFNSWVWGCSMVVIHELMTGNKHEMMQQLLSLVTEERILINAKHKGEVMRDIYANFLCFSNHGNAAAISTQDRRFFVYRSAAIKREADYYKKLFAWLDTDGPLHLLAYFHSMSFAGFNPGEAPMITAAKLSMISTNMSTIESIIRDAVEDKAGPFVADIVTAESVEKFLAARVELTNKDAHAIQRTLTSLCPPLQQDRYSIDKTRKQYRLRAVRNGRKWSRATPQQVRDEFLKSLVASGAPVVEIKSA